MNLNSPDRFAKIIDVLSIFLPGTWVAYFLMGRWQAAMFGPGKLFPSLHSTVQKWTAFFFAVLVASIIVVLLAMIFEKYVFDKFVSNRFLKTRIKVGNGTATRIREQYFPDERWISNLLLPEVQNADLEVPPGERESVKDNALDPCRRALTNIQPRMSHSNFFRNAMLAFFISGAVLIAKGEWFGSSCFIVLSLLCLACYGQLRCRVKLGVYEVIHAIDRHEIGDVAFWDNRADYLQSDITARRALMQLTQNLRVTTEVLSIPPGRIWRVRNSSSNESLFCFSGCCVAKLGSGNDLINKVIVSPNAIIPVHSQTSFDIKNAHWEPLILIAVKTASES